jgi:polyisoprenoid-binding protein YceI
MEILMHHGSVKTVVAALALVVAGVAQAESATYTIEPTHTWTTWEVKHFGTSTLRGRFDKKQGSVTIDRTAKTGHAEISIDLKSIDTGIAALDKHLSSKDFFDVEQFPEAKFVGDAFTFDGDKLTAVTGTLNLHGQTQPVTLKADGFNCYDHPMLKRQVCGGDFEATLDRAKWGISYPLGPSAEAVHLLIQVEAIEQ